MDQELLRDLGVNLLAGIILLGAGWLTRRLVPRAKLLARARAEEREARTRRRAAGIKGDGFSALFLLHRALHVRMQAVGWHVLGGTWVLCALVTNKMGWWWWLPFVLALEYCFFRAAYFGAQAAAMVEVAEEAVADERDAATQQVVEQKLP